MSKKNTFKIDAAGRSISIFFRAILRKKIIKISFFLLKQSLTISISESKQKEKINTLVITDSLKA